MVTNDKQKESSFQMRVTESNGRAARGSRSNTGFNIVCDYITFKAWVCLVYIARPSERGIRLGWGDDR